MFSRKLTTHLLALLLAVLPGVAAAQSLDLVNDDTDLFTANPSLGSPEPNVLILLDNSANWTSVFVNEMAALSSTANAINDGFNVGLMLYSDQTTAEGDGGKRKGAWPRFAMRPTATYKNDLAKLISNFDDSADKGDNVFLSLAMYEMYLYFTGKEARAGIDYIKRDYGGNTTTPVGALPLNAFDNAADTTYNLPSNDICARNYIIVIANGAISENTSNLVEAAALLTAAGGDATQIPVPENGGYAQYTLADEYARFMANTDLDNDATNGIQNVRTYTVEVDPNFDTAKDFELSAMLKSMAKQGGGKYFGVTSGSGGSQITEALLAIFNEIQGVNSVFAATTLPVSVNVRGTNLNQIYIGMFRPDEQRDPRWMGNVKLYQFAYDSTTDSVFLADANEDPAENKAKGFIAPNAVSFWTEPSSYWSFRPPLLNGSGGSSDSPDGEIVEKGGVAQQTRLAFPSDQSTRKLYTCTGCAAGATLGATIDTVFDTGNTNITNEQLDLGRAVVDPLTGYRGKLVSTLTDRLPVTLLSNPAGPTISVDSISNGSATATINTLSTAGNKVVTSLSAGSNPDRKLTQVYKSGGWWVFEVDTPHTFLEFDTVYITGTGCPEFNDKFWTIQGNDYTGLNNWFAISPGGGFKCSTPTPYLGGEVYKGTAPGPTTTARATVSNHGYSSGDKITISGASPSDFNGVWPITVVDANTFTYVLSSPQATATVASGYTAILASANTTIATAKLAAPLTGVKQGDSVTISGANPADYNGTYSVSCIPAQAAGTVCIDATRFSYDVGLQLTPNTNATGVQARVGGSLTATVSTAKHTFLDGASVAIAGAIPNSWNGTYTITYVDDKTFKITTSTVLPSPPTGTIIAYDAVSTSPTVTAQSAAHGFTVGQSVQIENASPASHNGTWVISGVPNADTFTYSTGAAMSAPSGAPTVRPAAASRAYAWVTAHGWSSGQQVLIEGADPADYNGEHTITVIDANRFSYAMVTSPDPDGFGGASGVNTSGTVSAKVKTTSALAVSPGHGFTTGDSVTVSGASPSAFNGTFTVTVLDSDVFSYTLATPQGDASGLIYAAVALTSTAKRDELIRWVRGEDNAADENSNALYTDVRASIHGDVLHSRPAVINYNRRQADTANIDNDVYVFYGANDGIFRAVKGGKGSSSGDPKPGTEVWGFVAPEHFNRFNRLRKNFPPVSSANKKDYFFDGNVSAYTFDADGDAAFSSAGDEVYVYSGMRRGGRALYAFDALDPLAPKFLWKINNATPGFAELGQTWSEAKVINQIPGSADPVLLFGAGWDPDVEDIPTDLITSVTSTSVTTTAGTVNRSMGRGIYIVNARTGALIWRALGTTPADSTSGTTLIVPGMDCSIPSDVAVIKPKDSLYQTRAYVGDTCGNLWRIDYGDASPANWSVTKIASIGNWSSVDGRRKILYPPDVVFADNYYALLVGTGDREHPFDTSVTNRFYMFKDFGLTGKPVTANASTVPALSPLGTDATITESDLLDVSDNCIQDAAACPSGTTPADAEASLKAADGWYLTLDTGEKSIGTAVTIAGTVFFGTNQPSSASSVGVCEPNLGIARAYQVSFFNGSAAFENDGVLNLTAADRFQVVPGGGFLPSAVASAVSVGGVDSDGDGVYEVAPVQKTPVCLGTRCVDAPGSAMQTRVRSFWYKEID